MVVFAIGIENSSTFRLSRMHHADGGEHRWAAEVTTSKSASSHLPFVCIVVLPWAACDVVASVLQGDELNDRAAGESDRRNAGAILVAVQ